MSLMPTSRRSRQPKSARYRVFTEYASLAAAEPVTVEVETALTPENEGQPAAVEEVTLTPGTARWRGIVGFENEMTGDGRIIAENALRWPEDLAENPIPIRYVSSDVGAHDGAVVVGLIDTLERQAPLENGSIPIYGEGVFDDDENATVAQEAFRLVDKKMTNGVSMDLDDVAFEVQNDGDQETVSTHDARIRAVTIVAIPAFANARIGLFGPDESREEVVSQVTELSDASPKLERAAELISEHNEVVRTNSSRGMRAHAITKAKLRRLASRSTAFAYQTTKIKDPEGNWVETPAAAIDIASNSTPPDDSFQKGLDILNEADMLELGSSEYLAKVREAVPMFEQALDDGGDRGPDAKKVLEILESYLDIDWPVADDDAEAVATEQGADATEAVEDAAEDVTAGAEQKTAAETTTLAAETETLAFNPDQWRNPRNGQWIDMPTKLFNGLFDLIDSDESGLNDSQYDSVSKPLREAEAEAGLADDAIRAKDYPAAVEHIGNVRDQLGGLDGVLGGLEGSVEPSDLNEITERVMAVDSGLQNQETSLVGVPAGLEDSEIGSFDPEEVVEVTLPSGGTIEAGGPAIVPSDAPIRPSGRVLDFDDPEPEYDGPGRLTPVDREAGTWIGTTTDSSGNVISSPALPRDEAEQWLRDNDPSAESDGDKIEETAIEEGSQALDQLEMEWDQELPDEANKTLTALDALNLDDAEKSFAEVKALLQDAQDGYLGDDDEEGGDRINFLANIVDTLARTIDRWKSEQNYNNGTDYAYDPEQAVAWAAEFNVPDAQVEEMLQVLATVQKDTPEWDELSSASQMFVQLARAGVDPKDALATYLKTLDEMGHGAIEFTLGARRGQVFNWVDDVNGLPKYIRNIADALMKRGQGESRAIATAVNTVKRWAKGGPARAGGKGSVSAATVAKAVKALAEWEAKKAQANATAAQTTVLAAESTSVTASGGWGTPYATTKERAHSEKVSEMRQDLLSRVRGDDVVAEAESITAAAAKSALAMRPTVKLNSKSRIPVAPPEKWFANPALTEPTPITIDEDGRVYGHLASWNVCHVASPAGEGICVMAPKSRTGYAYFHTGAVKTKEGNVLATGRLCMNGAHAASTLNYAATMAHYDDTSLAVADVRVGEDKFGIWVAGAMRPDITEKQIRTFRASPVSGDWRKIGGNLELTIGLNVNAPGYPVPRPMGLVASIGGDSEAQDHELISLVAAGMLPPVDAPLEDTLSPADVKYLKSLAAQMKDQEALAKREKVEALAAKMKAQKARAQVAAFAAKRQTMNTTTEGSN
ncbi:capsid maturation protease [Microbacterium phage Rasputia]|nr:capsid maturation protease [Microbacterium phage Rasputia]